MMESLTQTVSGDTAALLNMLQNDFPLEPSPYSILAKRLNSTEEEVIERIKQLKEKGVIRRLGGIFDSKSLGYASVLCAMAVPKNQIDEITQVINSYEGVTHNYLRSHRYNIWFTLIGEEERCLQKIIDEIKYRTGIQKIMVLKAVKTFKIKVDFNLKGGIET